MTTAFGQFYEETPEFLSNTYIPDPEPTEGTWTYSPLSKTRTAEAGADVSVGTFYLNADSGKYFDIKHVPVISYARYGENSVRTSDLSITNYEYTDMLGYPSNTATKLTVLLQDSDFANTSATPEGITTPTTFFIGAAVLDSPDDGGDEGSGSGSGIGDGPPPPVAASSENIWVGEVKSDSMGSSYPVYDGNEYGEYNAAYNTGKVHSINNGSSETIYIRLMAKTYNNNSSMSFDAMGIVVYSNIPEENDREIYVGHFGGIQNANYVSSISLNSPAYSGEQYVLTIPPTGTRNASVGIHPAHYTADGDGVRYSNSNSGVVYSFAWSTNKNFDAEDQTEIRKTTYCRQC